MKQTCEQAKFLTVHTDPKQAYGREVVSQFIRIVGRQVRQVMGAGEVILPSATP